MVLSACKEKEAVSCAEDAVQVRRRSHGRRCYYGPASDAEFLRSIADKTPGREDQINHMRRSRQVYLKSYVFVTNKDDDDRELRRRRHHQQTSSSRWWCARTKKAGKVLSHVLDRLLLACTCNIDPASDSSSSHAGAAA